MRRIGIPEVFSTWSDNELLAPTLYDPPLYFSARGRCPASPGVPMHTFVDDWRIEFFWRRPEEGLLIARLAGVVTAPDFTVHVNDPAPWRQYQAWRSAVIAKYWIDNGVIVYPVVSFCTPIYFQRGSIWAIRGPSRKQDLDDYMYYLDVWRRLSRPSGLIVFGNSLPSGLAGLKGVKIWERKLNYLKREG